MIQACGIELRREIPLRGRSSVTAVGTYEVRAILTFRFAAGLEPPQPLQDERAEASRQSYVRERELAEEEALERELSGWGWAA